MTTIPTRATTVPVTSGGKRDLRCRIAREKRDSRRPNNILIPKIKGNPPRDAACTDALKYVGLLMEGQRYPEPMPFFFSACNRVMIPEVIIEMLTKELAVRRETGIPRLLIIMTGKMDPINKSIVC
jgi:hypothetical protein